jgi:hypothetical protein
MKRLTEGVHTAAYRKILIPLFLLLFPLITTAQTSVPEEVSNADKIAELSTGLNTVWMLLAAMLVFFMQPGFALVEAGFTRSKNTANILMKNLVDFMVGSILFWFIGFGLMFGVGNVFGTPHLFDLDAMDNIIQNGLPIEGFLIFQTVFCATSATIVSGAMAELVLLTAGHMDRNAAGQGGDGLVAHKAGLRDDHLVPGLHQRADAHINGFAAAHRHQDLPHGVVPQAHAPFQIAADLGPQLL